MQNAVIYARYSSANQREASIEQQVSACRDFAAKQRLTVVAVYADHAISGTTDRRPDFQRMIADSAKGGWQYVIVYSLDRFARDRYDSVTYKHKLKKNGVKCLSATENITDDAAGIITESLLEGMAEYYSAELSRKVTRGLMDNASKGLVTGSLPLGYCVGPDHRYAICEQEAVIVRELFSRVRSGEPICAIVDDFNARSLRTKFGKSFTKSSFNKILHNERYTGTYIYKDIRVEGVIPAIISKPEFQEVQKYLTNKKNPRQDKSSPHPRRRDTALYLLTGKLYCGHCREPMVGVSGHSRNGETHNYYACKGRRSGNGCKKHNVRKEDIESRVAASLIGKVLTDEAIDYLAEAAVKSQEASEAELEIQSLESQLAETKDALKNLLKAIEMGIFNSMTKQRMDDLCSKQTELDQKIQILRSKMTTQITKEEYIALLRSYRCGDISDKLYKESLIDAFVVRVYLYDDHFDTIFSIGKGSTTTITTAIPDNLDEIDVRIEDIFPHQQKDITKR